MATVPFENLALHYSPHHSITLDPDFLFDKIVERKRGGYCMENNCFFGTVLRTLGFTVVSIGARVSNTINHKAEPGFSGLYGLVIHCLLDLEATAA